MTVDNELWIDLHALAQSSSIDKGHAVIYFQYPDGYSRNDCIAYMVRKAVRAVEFKITKIETLMNSDYRVVQEVFHTDIPGALWESTLKTHNEWVAQVCMD